MNKLNNFARMIVRKANKFKVETTAAVGSAVVMVAGSAFAAPGDVADTVKTSVQTAATDTIELILGLLPIALTVFAVTWGVRKGMKFFKGAAN